MTAELIHSPDTHRLGKNEAKAPHAMLSEFVDVERVSAEEEIPANIVNSGLAADGSEGMTVALAMYLNDNEGDCTIAGVGNTLRVQSDGGTEVSDPDIQTGYVAVTKEEGAAYDPATGANDNGCVELDVLDYSTTVGIGGVKLVGHAGVKFSSETELRAALYLCGAIYPGWQLSTDQQSQPIWGPGNAAPGSWGGHCAPIFDWWTEIPSGLVIGGVPISTTLGDVFNVGTWGAYKPCLGGPKGFTQFACDEAHVLLTEQWLARNQGSPYIDQQKLAAYLKTLQPES